MNSDGLKATGGMSSVFNIGVPVDAFVSNRAYGGEGFVQMFCELHPLGTNSDDAYMEAELNNYASSTNNLAFQHGSRMIPIAAIANPSDIGSTATKILHLRHIRPVQHGPFDNLSANLMCDITVALLRFESGGKGGKGADIYFKITNYDADANVKYEVIKENVNYERLLASIRYFG